MTKRWLKDVSERVFWTAAEAGIALATTEVANLGSSWAIPIAAGLALVKGYVAKHVGNRETASLTKEL